MSNPVSYCSFCGKSQDEALCLIAGPGNALFICDQCTEFCRDLVGKHRSAKCEVTKGDIPK